jgi:hypothetical protein
MKAARAETYSFLNSTTTIIMPMFPALGQATIAPRGKGGCFDIFLIIKEILQL